MYIGNENNIDDDLTVIKTKYNVNGREGTLAILGPKRMEYDRVVSLLEYLKDEIDKIFEVISGTVSEKNEM